MHFLCQHSPAPHLDKLVLLCADSGGLVGLRLCLCPRPTSTLRLLLLPWLLLVATLRLLLLLGAAGWGDVLLLLCVLHVNIARSTCSSTWCGLLIPVKAVLLHDVLKLRVGLRGHVCCDEAAAVQQQRSSRSGKLVIIWHNSRQGLACWHRSCGMV